MAEQVVVTGEPVKKEGKTATKGYRLLQGKRHTHDGAAVKPGEVVQLTDAQAYAFRDKFVPEGAKEPAPAPVVGSRVTPVVTPADNSKHEQQDISAKNNRGTANVGNAGNA